MMRLIREDHAGTHEWKWNDELIKARKGCTLWIRGPGIKKAMRVRKAMQGWLENGDVMDLYDGNPYKLYLTGFPDKPERVICTACGGRGNIEKPNNSKKGGRKR